MPTERWEYCWVAGALTMLQTVDGPRRIETPNTPEAATIAHLGLDGWELVAVTPTGTHWFKRRVDPR